MRPAADDRFDEQAGLLLLAFAGSSEDGTLPLDDIAALLTEFGWRLQNGGGLHGHDLYRLPQYDRCSTSTTRCGHGINAVGSAGGIGVGADGVAGAAVIGRADQSTVRFCSVAPSTASSDTA